MKTNTLAGKNLQGDFSSFVNIKKSKFKCRSSHTRLHLPEDIFFEIILRLPAKSVARFRCVSTVWLSITTDPSFILTHARCAQKSLILRSISTKPKSRYHNRLLSINASGLSGSRRNFYHISDFAISSCDGLVLFLKKIAGHPPYDKQCYVMNPLTRLHIDLPQLNRSNRFEKRIELYYHRWTGEYRILYLSRCKEPHEFHLDAEVLSLGGTCSSWRQIQAKAPVSALFYYNSQIQMNDKLYWACPQCVQTPPPILVFDILKETFSILELPSYSQKSAFPSFSCGTFLKYGLVNMEGILCLWFVYRDKNCIKNVMIDVWEAVDGNEKWKNTYSLCLVDEYRWALEYPSEGYTFLVSCLCFKGRELVFLFNGPSPPLHLYEQNVQYMFNWNLKSGKYWTREVFSHHEMMNSALLHRESLINPPPLCHATLTLTGSPT